MLQMNDAANGLCSLKNWQAQKLARVKIVGSSN